MALDTLIQLHETHTRLAEINELKGDLPELLILLPKLVLPIRKNNGRIAILDGRLRSRSWGQQVLDALDPWIPLDRLLPD